MSLSFRISCLTFVLLAVGIDVSAQSIADIARKERERHQGVRSTVVVVAGQTTTPPTAGTAKTAAAAPVQPQAVKPVVVTDNKGHDEKYWRELFQKAREAQKRADDRAQLLDLQLKDYNTKLLTRTDMYDRENRLAPAITDAQRQLDEARKESQDAKQRLSDLEDELRKAGGPAGWAR